MNAVEHSEHITGVAGKFIAPPVIKNKEININNKLKVGGLKTMQIMHPLYMRIPL